MFKVLSDLFKLHQFKQGYEEGQVSALNEIRKLQNQIESLKEDATLVFATIKTSAVSSISISFTGILNINADAFFKILKSYLFLP
jgi:hypothetical protein